ncbi:hypothetical protein GSI_07339 [Ganoderma sinense ZZ0214-1]|uniref:Uncharacterized protein n=1 Tax=Ganoderma sinense ZZ0214-1 TaxID=1077348 RepID=A0A2G8SA56_9APHY|nr:hypothetical protein GSI_07339 [Ganoderma sinense ZZ0214-1]
MRGSSLRTMSLFSWSSHFATASAQNSGLSRRIERHRRQTWGRRRLFQSCQQLEKTRSSTSVGRRWMGAARLWIARRAREKWRYSSALAMVHAWMFGMEVRG